MNKKFFLFCVTSCFVVWSDYGAETAARPDRLQLSVDYLSETSVGRYSFFQIKQGELLRMKKLNFDGKCRLLKSPDRTKIYLLTDAGLKGDSQDFLSVFDLDAYLKNPTMRPISRIRIPTSSLEHGMTRIGSVADGCQLLLEVVCHITDGRIMSHSVLKTYEVDKEGVIECVDTEALESCVYGFGVARYAGRALKAYVLCDSDTDDLPTLLYGRRQYQLASDCLAMAALNLKGEPERDEGTKKPLLILAREGKIENEKVQTSIIDVYACCNDGGLTHKSETEVEGKCRNIVPAQSPDDSQGPLFFASFDIVRFFTGTSKAYIDKESKAYGVNEDGTLKNDIICDGITGLPVDVIEA